MMSVGRRLMLALLPAIFGLCAAVGLAYYGEYQRQAPEWFVAVALVSTVASLVVAWLATRHVAGRIERLADWRTSRGGALQRAAVALQADGVAVDPPSRGIDELDAIERIIDRLTATYTGVRADRERLAARLEELRAEYARLVSHASEEMVRQLEDVRLPLHILLENRFGELNENQEEMLGAARNAAEVADQVALRLRDIARLDLGVLHLRSDLVRLADLMATITPGIAAEAAQRAVQFDVALAPAIPSFSGDRERLQEALATLVREAVRRAPTGGGVYLGAETARGELRITVTGAQGAPATEERALPLRIVHAHHGRIEETPGLLTVVLPLRPPS